MPFAEECDSKKSDRRDGLLTARLILFVPAIWVAIIPALNNVIQFLEGGIHPQVIATVVGCKEFTSFRVERNVKRIPHAACINLTLTGLDVETQDRGTARVRIITGITGGSNPDIKPSIRTKFEVIILMFIE